MGENPSAQSESNTWKKTPAGVNVIPKENMNAKCYCGHRLSQHIMKDGKSSGCGMCGCDKFTEDVKYRCEVCDEPIPIQFAPNDEIVRLRYKDDGRNYAHKKCMVKRRDSGLTKSTSLLKPAVLVLSKESAVILVKILERLELFDPSGEVDTSILEDTGEVNLLKTLMNFVEKP